MECTSNEVIAQYLPQRIREPLLNLGICENISELRINSGRAAALIYPDKIKYLTYSGTTASANNTAVIIVTPAEISGIVDALSHYSIHSCTRQLTDGCFVLRGGVRVGMSGICNSDGVLTDITGLNFRISRNVAGCASQLYELVAAENCGLLICGGVNSGKTTVLRDLCRLIGNRRKTVLVDERNEIAYTSGGVIENDVGTLTNVLTGNTRAKSIVSAVRTLSPDFIFCDELSTAEDVKAITDSVGCGVNFCATIHGRSFDEIIRRKIASELVKFGIFRYAAVMAGSEYPGKIAEIRRLAE
ncbi:MAG: Flp pilus assembly complex ATPase component TadA [Ruminococcus sp.]|nr:Flp pilus assembly complex ATPase component TadA [Ruminococcus sp.]